MAYLCGFLLVFSLLIFSVEGRICWKCDATSHQGCRRGGRFIGCPSFDDICSTTTRQNQNGEIHVVKECKQRDACLSDQNQNWGFNSTMQCDESEFAVCRCCCFENYCNSREMCQQRATQMSPMCPQLPREITDGRIVCSNSNRLRSKCHLFCMDGRHQFNSDFQFVCLPNGKWDKPVPCCSAEERCPPTLLLDLAVIMHVQSSQMFAAAFPVTESFLGEVRFGPDSLRYAIMYYSGAIHQPSYNFEDLMNLTTTDTIKKLRSEVIYENTADGRVNTGAALWHLKRNVFGDVGDRPDVQNAVVLITDENSDDDVKAPAKALRDAGVLIYSYFYKTDPKGNINMKQLKDISEDEPHIIVVSPDGQFEVTTDKILSEFMHNLCPASCPSMTFN